MPPPGRTAASTTAARTWDMSFAWLRKDSAAANFPDMKKAVDEQLVGYLDVASGVCAAGGAAGDPAPGRKPALAAGLEEAGRLGRAAGGPGGGDLHVEATARRRGG